MQEDEASEVKYVTIDELKKIIKDKDFVLTIGPSLNIFLTYMDMIRE